jgi:O-antigen ligase
VAAALAVAYWLSGEIVAGESARPVAFLGLGTVLAVIALHPAAGMLLWIVLAPFGALFNLSMGHGLPDLSINRLAALFTLMVLLAQVAAGRRKLLAPRSWEWFGLALLAALLFSVPSSWLGPAGALQGVFDRIAVPLLVGYLARSLFRSPRDWVAMLAALALVGAAMGLIAAREQLTNQPFLSPTIYRWQYGASSIKVTSLFGAPAIMSLTLAMVFPAIVTGLARSRGAATTGWLLALAAGGAGLFFTYVRAGWLAALAAVAVLALLSGRSRRLALLVVPVVGVVALLFGLGLLAAPAAEERLASEAPIEYRRQALQTGLVLLKRSPVRGLGFDNYGEAAIAAGWAPRNTMGLPNVAPHNLLVYVATSAGLLALIPLVGMYAAIVLWAFGWWRGLHRAGGAGREIPALVLATTTALLVFAMTFDSILALVANMIFFLVVGVAAGVELRRPAPP